MQFFWLVTDSYREGTPKEMKKWSYEIYSTFLAERAVCVTVLIQVTLPHKYCCQNNPWLLHSDNKILFLFPVWISILKHPLYFCESMYSRFAGIPCWITPFLRLLINQVKLTNNWKLLRIFLSPFPINLNCEPCHYLSIFVWV